MEITSSKRTGLRGQVGHLKMIYPGILFLSVLDHLFTVWHLKHGAVEANPLMQGVMNMPFWCSFIIKNGWVVAMLVLLFYLEKKGARVVRPGLGVILFAHCLVICWHIYGFVAYHVL